jgi:predicted dehydrogenase
MDYLRESLTFKVRKLVRYARLYGIDRTRIKVLGQLHMRRRLEILPPQLAIRPGQSVGLIGCGNYAFSNIAYYLRRNKGAVIGACMDADLNRAASLARQYRVPVYTDDAEELLKLPEIELVFIASNHASHAEYAIRALDLGKDVYIEKPHVVNEDQLERLSAAMRRSKGRVFLGFNRPGSRFGELILQYMAAQPGSAMYSWFVAGHAIDPDHWYFRPEEGGRVLGNLCHWTDFVLRCAPDQTYPIEITPTRAAKSDCDIAVTYVFPDETIAVITFSAKGHTFEGVKERLSAHKGDCLLVMEDYHRMTVDIGSRKHHHRLLFRDHGHERNIVRAFEAATGRAPYDRDSAVRHAEETAWLFLKTKQALDENRPIRVEEFASTAPSLRSAS